MRKLVLLTGLTAALAAAPAVAGPAVCPSAEPLMSDLCAVAEHQAAAFAALRVGDADTAAIEVRAASAALKRYAAMVTYMGERFAAMAADRGAAAR